MMIKLMWGYFAGCLIMYLYIYKMTKFKFINMKLTMGEMLLGSVCWPVYAFKILFKGSIGLELLEAFLLIVDTVLSLPLINNIKSIKIYRYTKIDKHYVIKDNNYKVGDKILVTAYNEVNKELGKEIFYVRHIIDEKAYCKYRWFIDGEYHINGYDYQIDIKV